MANWLDDSAEAELVQGLRDRSPAAAETLERLFLARLKGVAQATWGLQEADAYSVALETLMKVVRGIDSFTERPGAKFRSWVLRIMLNCLKDFVRRRKQQREREVSGDALAEIEGAEEPEDAGERVVARRATLVLPTASDEPQAVASPAMVVATAVLERLTPRERDVMLLTRDRLSDADIADRLQISLVAVRVTRSRARSHAQEALAEIAPTLDERIQRKFRKLLS